MMVAVGSVGGSVSGRCGNGAGGVPRSGGGVESDAPGSASFRAPERVRFRDERIARITATATMARMTSNPAPNTMGGR
jgi:hypothetical protein